MLLIILHRLSNDLILPLFRGVGKQCTPKRSLLVTLGDRPYH